MTPFPKKIKDLQSENVVLIIDKKGLIGAEMCKKIQKETTVVFVSGYSNSAGEKTNVFLISYKKRFPTLPDFPFNKIFVVCSEEKQTQNVIRHFVGHAEKTKAKLFLILAINSKNQHLAQGAKSSYKKTNIIYYDEFFGGELLDAGSLVDNFLFEAKTKGRIVVGDVGVSKVNTVALVDGVNEIIKASKLENEGKTFLLFPQHSPTQLTMARIFKKIDPELRLDFIEKKNVELKDKIIEEGQYLVSDDYPYEARIKDCLSNIRHKPIKDFSLSFESEKQINGSKFKFNPLPSLLGFILAIIFLPLIISVFFAGLGFLQLKSVKNSFESNNYKNAYSSSIVANKFFMISESSAQIISYEVGLLNKKDIFSRAISNISAGKQLTEIINNSLDAFFVIKKVFNGESLNPRNDLGKSLNKLELAMRAFEKMKIENYDTFVVRSIPVSEDSRLSNAIRMFSATKEVLPKIFGFNGKFTYLVLFQNNMELRPGGGFIGSYGLLTLENGKISDFTVNDVYDADGQLKGHIEPPYPIRRYVPSVHWYLRDSNFDVDFSKNAEKAAYFLNLETGKKADAVIAVDVSYIKDLVGALGGVFVPDYNETVNSDNFYILTQAHAEKKSFYGSTQKKDFLRSLFNSLELAVTANSPYVKIADVTVDSVRQKHVLVAFSDPDLQNIFTVNNMSSSLWDNRENGPGIVNDFFGLNEANFGVNKANYFMRKKIEQNVSISPEGTLSETTTIRYKNLSESGIWPGGDYKAYARLILPIETEIESVNIDGQEQKIIPAVTNFSIYEQKGFIPPSGLEIDKQVENGKAIYGFLFIVPSQTFKTISVKYNFPVVLNNSQLSYSLRLFKQPGTENDPYSLTINYPSGYSFVNASENVEKNDNQIVFEDKLRSDFNFSANFSKK